MRVIGHRGAAGLALENTLESVKRAVSLGADAVEFDVRLTRDRHLVLSHDPDLSRVSTSHARLEDLDFAQLRKIKLNNGELVPTLGEALDAVATTPAIIEVKVDGCAQEVLAEIDRHPRSDISVATFRHGLAEQLKELRPGLRVYLAGLTNPNDTFETARRIKADGLDINAWTLNILVYKLALRRGLKIMVYTINQTWVAWFINRFYPDVAIVTDFPDKLLKWRNRRSSQS